MANRITIYGIPSDRDSKRLKREMNVMTLEYEFVEPAKDPRASTRLNEWNAGARLPIVEVTRRDDQGSVFMTNPDEPTLRQCLHSEGILSITSYWV